MIDGTNVLCAKSGTLTVKRVREPSLPRSLTDSPVPEIQCCREGPDLDKGELEALCTNLGFRDRAVRFIRSKIIPRAIWVRCSAAALVFILVLILKIAVRIVVVLFRITDLVSGKFAT